MSIYLIRHGKTAANEAHLYCGSTDVPLSDGGIAQLRELSYSGLSPVRFVTSGMRRTDETLAVLFGAVPFTKDPRFREVSFGVFEMQSYEQLKGCPDYQRWLTGDNEANTPPGGESGSAMTARVTEAFSTLADGTLVVTHGGVIAAIMAHLFPEEGKNRYQWQPACGCGYAIDPGYYRPIP